MPEIESHYALKGKGVVQLGCRILSPSMRAAGSDLAISISPLGLVELAD